VNTNKEHILSNINAVKPIYSITPFTLLDFPDKTACILWYAGCNMRCLYCYNPDIVLGKGKLSIDDALAFLKTRRNLLDGVVMSGGECTSHKTIIPLLQEIKKLGFLVKIDTNGSNPKVLKYLIENSLVDYVALDFKAAINKFKLITKSDNYNDFIETLITLIKSKISFEVRTTIHSDLLKINDIQEMIDVLECYNYSGIYYLQHYRNNSNTLSALNDSKNKYIDISALKTHLIIHERNLC